MSRTQSDFDDRQREAVVSAVLVSGMSSRVVAAAAFAGTLGPSFKISPSSVSAFAREARAERDTEERPQDGHDLAMQVRLDGLWDRLIALAEDAVGQLEDEESELDVGRLRQLAGLTRSLAKPPGPASPERRSTVERQTSALVARLAVVAEGAHEAGDDNGNAA